jgi:hypothetical protein
MPEALVGAVRSQLLESADRGLFIDSESGAFLAGHRPDLGRLSFEVCLFPPATPQLLLMYEQHLEIVLPELVKQYLCAFNGARFFEFSIWGADPFFAKTPLPDLRPTYHCADIGTDLKVRNRFGPPTFPILGARNVSLEEVHRFMLVPNVGIHEYDRSGTHVDTWREPAEWLQAQISEAAAFTGEWRVAMAQLLSDTSLKKNPLTD